MVVMNNGEVIAQGTPRQALTKEVLAAAYGIDVEIWDDPRGDSPVIVPRGVLGE